MGYEPALPGLFAPFCLPILILMEIAMVAGKVSESYSSKLTLPR
jgi:hypothetical protein